ncbi:hypothetical protein F5B20DRAFT_583115 [Whalleya microplaca]|nr:hypothetical protein F5B20DRAFT_583115 [Whalleya microplaca]
MAPQALGMLSFSHIFRPGFTDADIVRFLLENNNPRLPPELVLKVVALSYDPWVSKCRDYEKRYYARFTRLGEEASVAGLYLSAKLPLVSGRRVVPQRIIFQTRAADQGWADNGGKGTFHNSHTWFEAGILRPTTTSTDQNGRGMPLEDVLTDTWWDVAAARAALRGRGWDFVETEEEQITWRVCNNITAQREYQDYRVEWRRGIETQVEDERAVGRGNGFWNCWNRDSSLYFGREQRKEPGKIELEQQLLRSSFLLFDSVDKRGWSYILDD